jgi:GNAT superfamily N-acetyltransferase
MQPVDKVEGPAEARHCHNPTSDIPPNCGIVAVVRSKGACVRAILCAAGFGQATREDAKQRLHARAVATVARGHGFAQRLLEHKENFDKTSGDVMFSISSLMRALPISGLEPQEVARLRFCLQQPDHQTWQGDIILMEPPAGRRAPYVNPEAALITLLRHQSMSENDARSQAKARALELRLRVPDTQPARFLDEIDPDSPECIPAMAFADALKQNQIVPAAITEFLEKSIHEAARRPLFRGPDNRANPWSLLDLPELPPSRSMFEFTPEAPWSDLDQWGSPKDWPLENDPFMQWRTAMQPIAQELERALGEPVYRLADLHDELDADAVHRFLILHWCCTHKPESEYVKYLMRASGAENVNLLKAALIDPAHYIHPFKMNAAFFGLETLPYVIHHA